MHCAAGFAVQRLNFLAVCLIFHTNPKLTLDQFVTQQLVRNIHIFRKASDSALLGPFRSEPLGRRNE
jgi:hypothetical protein